MLQRASFVRYSTAGRYARRRGTHAPFHPSTRQFLSRCCHDLHHLLRHTRLCFDLAVSQAWAKWGVASCCFSELSNPKPFLQRLLQASGFVSCLNTEYVPNFFTGGRCSSNDLNLIDPLRIELYRRCFPNTQMYVTLLWSKIPRQGGELSSSYRDF